MSFKSRLFHTTRQTGVMFHPIKANPLAVRASTYSTKVEPNLQSPKIQHLMKMKAYFCEDFTRPVYKYRGGSDKILLGITTVAVLLGVLEGVRVAYMLGWKKR